MKKLYYIDLDPEQYIAEDRDGNLVVKIKDFEPKPSYHIPWAYYEEDPDKKYWPHTSLRQPHQDGFKEVNHGEKGYIIGLLKDLKKQDRCIIDIPVPQKRNEFWREFIQQQILAIFLKTNGKKPEETKIQEILNTLIEDFDGSTSSSSNGSQKKGTASAPIKKNY